MTDEKFDQILHQALTPEVADGDIQIDRSVRKRNVKRMVTTGIAAACAALIVAANVGGLFSENVVVPLENPFVLTCFAAAMEEGELVQVPEIFSGNSVNGYVVCGGEDYESVSYAIGAEFICEGEEISSITYSINEGAFGVTQLTDDRLITDYVEYSGSELKYPDLGFADEALDHGREPSESDYEKLFVSEYTVSYDRQSLATAIVGIYGEKTDGSIYQSIFGDGTSQEQNVAGYTAMVDGVEITCTVNYADGTTDSKVIGITGCVQEEGVDSMPGFAYELK
jgi:hypothetical protein